MDCVSVDILVLILYFSFGKCYHWGKLGKCYIGSRCTDSGLNQNNFLYYLFFLSFFSGMEFLISLTSDRCCPKCQRLVGWLRRTQWTFYHYYDFRQAKWQQMDQIACWSGVCASSQPAESPCWVPQGTVFAFHSQMLHTRHQRVSPHISFTLLMHPCHSWIPLSQLASLSSPHVPVFNPRISTLHDSMLPGVLFSKYGP